MRETIYELLHRQPFVPFEVRLSNGDVYAVAHPEFALLLKYTLIIGLPDTDRFVVCSLLHVAGVQAAERARAS